MDAVPLTHRTAEPILDAVLRTWLQDALAFAEALFGPRDPAWQVGAVCVVPGGPHTFFPAGAHQVVEVHLGPYAQHFAPTAFFQLAHEAVHLLNPRAPVSLFEDGLATWASLAFVRARTPWQDMRPFLGPRFADALAAVEALLGAPEAADPVQAGAPVRALRTRVGALEHARADDLQAAWPALDRATAERLAGPAGLMRSAEVTPLPSTQGSPQARGTPANSPPTARPPAAPATPASVPFSDEWVHYWLLEALAYVEARCGARDSRFRLHPTTTGANGPICYTPTAPTPYPTARVVLSEGSRRTQWCAMFESAHEAVHLLTPRLVPELASLFEEGLATWMSVAYMWGACTQNVRPWLSPRYAEALALIEPLLGQANPGVPTPTTLEEINALTAGGHRHLTRDPIAAVLALRARAGALSDATADDLQAVWPTLDRAAAERLAGLAGEMRPDRVEAAPAATETRTVSAARVSPGCACAICGARVPGFGSRVDDATGAQVQRIECPTCGTYECDVGYVPYLFDPDRVGLRPFLSVGLRAAADGGALPHLGPNTFAAFVQAGKQAQAGRVRAA